MSFSTTVVPIIKSTNPEGKGLHQKDPPVLLSGIYNNNPSLLIAKTSPFIGAIIDYLLN